MNEAQSQDRVGPSPVHPTPYLRLDPRRIALLVLLGVHSLVLAQGDGGGETRSVKDPELVYVGTNDLGYEEYRHTATGLELIYVPPGQFTMGSNDGYRGERPPHPVELDAYLIGKFELTVGQYRRFVEATSRKLPPSIDPDEDPTHIHGWYPRYFHDPRFDQYPMVFITYEDAKAWCTWAGMRLPTEAEWERAARGTDERRFPWGNEEPEATRCNYADRNLRVMFPPRMGPRSGWWDMSQDDGYSFTSPVGSYPAGRSAVGAYDMAGNVWEWCNDYYYPYYYGSCVEHCRGTHDPNPPPQKHVLQDHWYHPWLFGNCTHLVRNPQGPPQMATHGEDHRSIRGGSWNEHRDYLRTTMRWRRRGSELWPGKEAMSKESACHLGVRVARSVAPQ